MCVCTTAITRPTHQPAVTFARNMCCSEHTIIHFGMQYYWSGCCSNLFLKCNSSLFVVVVVAAPEVTQLPTTSVFCLMSRFVRAPESHRVKQWNSLNSHAQSTIHPRSSLALLNSIQQSAGVVKEELAPTCPHTIKSEFIFNAAAAVIGNFPCPTQHIIGGTSE